MKQSYAKITVSSAQMVADYLSRKISIGNDIRLQDVPDFGEVRDALYALTNDTDLIVTDESVVPEKGTRP